MSRTLDKNAAIEDALTLLELCLSARLPETEAEFDEWREQVVEVYQVLGGEVVQSFRRPAA